MTSPIELITVKCPACGYRFETEHRASINRMLDTHATDADIERWTTATRPECGATTSLGALIGGEDGDWQITSGDSA